MTTHVAITLSCSPQGAPASEIRIGRGVRDQLATCDDRPTFALVDARVHATAPDLLPATTPRLLVEAGEGLKTFAALERLLRAMVQHGLGRGARLVAIGGGTIGDLGGLAASLFLRGIELWQVPTTLLAMADSAVGGKTAINLPEGKNLVGTVHPAARVLIDPEFTTTESATNIRSGLAEAVKMAIGCDAQLFDLLQAQAAAVKSRDLDVLQEVVRLAVVAKIGIVERDLLETGERRLLNLGHTLGHALEAHSGWTLPHGLAVARGLFFAIDVAAALAAIAPADASRCRALLQVHGYSPEPLPPAAELLPFLRRDKKASGDTLHFAVPTRIGRSEVRPLPIAWLAERLGVNSGDNPATTRR